MSAAIAATTVSILDEAEATTKRSTATIDSFGEIAHAPV